MQRKAFFLPLIILLGAGSASGAESPGSAPAEIKEEESAAKSDTAPASVEPAGAKPAAAPAKPDAAPAKSESGPAKPVATPAGSDAKPKTEGQPEDGPAKAEKPRISPDLSAAVKGYTLARAKKDNGKFVLEEPEDYITWYLELEGMTLSEVRKISDDKRIVRAEFVQSGDPEEGIPDDRVSLDFTVARDSGIWKVADETVFSVNGRDRYVYTEDHKREPIRASEGEPGEGDEPPPLEDDIELDREAPPDDEEDLLDEG